MSTKAFRKILSNSELKNTGKGGLRIVATVGPKTYNRLCHCKYGEEVLDAMQLLLSSGVSFLFHCLFSFNIDPRYDTAVREMMPKIGHHQRYFVLQNWKRFENKVSGDSQEQKRMVLLFSNLTIEHAQIVLNILENSDLYFFSFAKSSNAQECQLCHLPYFGRDPFCWMCCGGSLLYTAKGRCKICETYLSFLNSHNNFCTFCSQLNHFLFSDFQLQQILVENGEA